MSNQVCCMVGCTNTYRNSKNISFFRFPSKPHDILQKNKWIQAVKRKGSNNQLWEPNQNSRICSEHFFDGKPSKHPNSPSFYPTIFPKIYKQKVPAHQSFDRFSRLQKRKSCNTIIPTNPIIPNDLPESNELDCPDTVKYTEDKSTQTSMDLISNNFEFSCFFSNNNVNTQANIVGLDSIYFKPKMIDKCEGSVNYDILEYFSGFKFIKNENHLISLCGVNLETFNVFLTYINYQNYSKKSKEDKLLLSLVKLKLGISFTSISIFFNLHRSTCSRIFKNVLKMLAVATKKIVFWPSKKSIISTLPQSFKQHYPNCRVIIDCTEIKTEQPPHVDQRAFMYSLYKSAYTCKFLVGIAPCGMITFVSKAYGGRASDSFITNDSGLLNLLEPGDQVMADKGFPGIKTSMDEKNSILVMPPFMHNGVFTEDEIIQTYNIASVRIHVERSIQRIKIYNILQKIPIELLECIDDIIFVCCVMTNLQPPIIKPNP